MCTGTVLLYKIPRVVIGENKNFMGAEALLREHNVEVIVLNDEETIDMMAAFIQQNPTLWYEGYWRGGLAPLWLFFKRWWKNDGYSF